MAGSRARDLARVAASAMLAACNRPAAPTVVAPVETVLPPLPSASVEDDRPRPHHEIKVAAPTNDPNCCKGMNECKGKGMCKTDDNACRGKNDCKGKGGCKPADCSRFGPP